MTILTKNRFTNLKNNMKKQNKYKDMINDIKLYLPELFKSPDELNLIKIIKIKEILKYTKINEL